MNRHFIGGSINQTPLGVKWLLQANVLIWFVFVVLLQGFVLKESLVFHFLGLVPTDTVYKFFLWQPVSYMFLHSTQITHILFNMFMLWMIGSELEKHWGRSFFIKYYFICGVGSGVFYILVYLIMSVFGYEDINFTRPVVGASGAIFGLLMAYGMLFQNRVILVMFLFPMKAKNFIILLIALELYTLLSLGLGGPVANLAHLGGLVIGFIYLKGRLFPPKKQYEARFGDRKLKLIKTEEPSNSQTWH